MLDAVAVGERDLRRGGGAERRGDAGDDLDRHARGAAGLGFLAAAAEHERIAALEAHDVAPGERLAHQQRVDRVLRQRVARAALGDRDQLRHRGGASASTAGSTSPSCTTSSASPSSRAARSVSRSGSPGPAPTR